MTTEDRLMEVEIKLSYTEDLIEELNLTIYRQQQQIDALIRQVQAIEQRAPEAGSGPRSARDELPPHY